jgi:hypothetical protein
MGTQMRSIRKMPKKMQKKAAGIKKFKVKEAEKQAARRIPGVYFRSFGQQS